MNAREFYFKMHGKRICMEPCKETASLVCSSPVLADKEVSAGSGNGLDLTGFVGNNSQPGGVSLVVVV